MAGERRTVEDCLARMRAAERRGKRAVAGYWREEAQRARTRELAVVPRHCERRAGRTAILELVEGRAA